MEDWASGQREETPGGHEITQGPMRKRVMIPLQDIIKLNGRAGIFRHSEADGVGAGVIVPELSTASARISEVAERYEVCGFRFEGRLRISAALALPSIAQGQGERFERR